MTDARQMWRMALGFLATLLLTVGSIRGEIDAEAGAEAARLHQQGQYTQAIEVAKKELADAEKTYGPDHTDVALRLSNLALPLGRLCGQWRGGAMTGAGS